MSNKANKVLVFSFSQVITLIINFFVSPYLSRSLSKPDYSAFNQVIIIIGLTGVLFSLGLQAVAFLFFSKKGPRQLEVISTLQFFILSVACLSAVGLFFFSFFTSTSLANSVILSYLKVCSVSIFFTFINNYFISVLVYNNKTKSVAVISVLTSIFAVSFIYISLNFWHSIRLALFFSQVITPFLGGVMTIFIARKFLLLRARPDKESAKTIFKASLPLYFTSLLGSSYLYVSSFFVIFLLGDIDYANYRNGAVEIPFISTIAFSVSAVLLPDLNKYFSDGNKSAALELKKKIINQCIFLLYPVIVFFIVYHFEFIVSYFSTRYAESAIVFAIYSCTCFVRINDYQDVLITAGKSSYIFKANIFYFLINVALVFLLGLFFGIKGVAAAASLSVFVLAFLLLKKDAEIFGIKIYQFFNVKQILHLLIVAFTFSLSLKYCLTYLFRFENPAVFLTASAVYFPVIYLFILRKGYIIPSVVELLRGRMPLISFFLPTKKV
jgi:O-antigen/teichoic acid export membrane protein